MAADASIRNRASRASRPCCTRRREQLFTVKPLAPTRRRRSIADVDVLVIVHPKGLSPATQFAIDQFALRGGHVIAFVDPLAEADQAGADPQNPDGGDDRPTSPPTLAKLLKAWGVDFNPREVIGDGELALQVGMRQGEAPVRHLGILGLDAVELQSRTTSSTSGLSNVNVATAGFVKPVKDAATKFEPLLQTSAQAAPMPLERFQMLFDPVEPARWLQAHRPALRDRRARHRQRQDGVPGRRARRRRAAGGQRRSRTPRSR